MPGKKGIWTLTEQITEVEYPIDNIIWKGESGNLLDLKFNGEFRQDTVDKQLKGLWRYRKALPVFDKKNIVTFGEGQTPVIKEKWNGVDVLFKLEFLFPTGSYKDRGAGIMISRLKELGVSSIVEDSSGNAGCAIAAYAAKAGMACEIYVSENISLNKLKQLEAYEAKVVKIPGNRDDVSREVWKKAQEVYYASHAWNPLFFQGTKTFAYEIWEQCKDNFPKSILMPVGNGTLLLGAHQGFSELYRRNLIPWMPSFFAAQATHVPSLTSTDVAGFKPTVAEGIAVANPVRRHQILDVIKATGGEVINVTEEEIEGAWKKLSRMGFYVEKTSAVGVAAFEKVQNPDAFLLPFTGSGLKISG